MVDHLGLKADKLSAFPAQSPVTSWSGTYAGLKVHVIHNGESCRGKQRSACMRMNCMFSLYNRHMLA